MINSLSCYINLLIKKQSARCISIVIIINIQSKNRHLWWKQGNDPPWRAQQTPQCLTHIPVTAQAPQLIASKRPRFSDSQWGRRTSLFKKKHIKHDTCYSIYRWHSLGIARTFSSLMVRATMRGNILMKDCWTCWTSYCKRDEIRNAMEKATAEQL